MARTPPLIPDDPAEALSAAYVKGLRLLGMREQSEAGVRQRLTAAGYAPGTVDAAVARLLQTGALDEERAVRAVARTLVHVKRRGRLRAQRELELRGFSKEHARTVLADLFATHDERATIERALDARLRGRPVTSGDVGAMRRLLGALIRQGFPPSLARDAVRSRFKNAPRLEDDADE